MKSRILSSSSTTTQVPSIQFSNLSTRTSVSLSSSSSRSITLSSKIRSDSSKSVSSHPSCSFARASEKILFVLSYTSLMINSIGVLISSLFTNVIRFSYWYPTTIMILDNPFLSRIRKTRSTSLTPPTSTIHFVFSLVNCPKRFPIPAARIIACIFFPPLLNVSPFC